MNGSMLNEFQYPQSDRSSFNFAANTGTLAEWHVSVSTIGSFIVQLGSNQTRHESCEGFSIHNRIVHRSTFRLRRRQRARGSFSIHNRIVHRSTAIRSILDRSCLGFSIHNRIVHRSTTEQKRDQRVDNVVSVSTIGSFIVQPGGAKDTTEE